MLVTCEKLLLSILAAFHSLHAVNVKVSSKNSEHAFGDSNFMANHDTREYIDSRCLDCICQKESMCNHDEGCSQDKNGMEMCGSYQISQTYYEACCDILGLPNCNSDSAWRRCALDYNCATRCVRAYVNFYGESCYGFSNPTCDTFSRVHIGGPDGCHNPNTTSFWNDIQQCYGAHNPYLYPCITDSDCTNSQHYCYNGTRGYGTDPNGWHCYCLAYNDDCTSDADCCTNVCENNANGMRTCSNYGGDSGAICLDYNSQTYPCANGCQCIPFENCGYCQC